MCEFPNLTNFKKFTVHVNLNRQNVTLAFQGLGREEGGEYKGMSMRDSNRKDKWLATKNETFYTSLTRLIGVRLVVHKGISNGKPIQLDVTLERSNTHVDDGKDGDDGDEEKLDHGSDENNDDNGEEKSDDGDTLSCTPFNFTKDIRAETVPAGKTLIFKQLNLITTATSSNPITIFKENRCNFKYLCFDW